MSDPTDDRFVLGYIVIVDRESEGWVGGYLCADERGVPLEFWHTSGVKTDRMQELLYGKTLKPEVFGRHIAGALLKDAQTTPVLVLAEDEAVLNGFTDAEVPILQVLRPGADDEPNTRKVQTGCGELLIRCREGDGERCDGLLDKLSDVDVLEPFDRVRALLDELAQESTADAGE